MRRYATDPPGVGGRGKRGGGGGRRNSSGQPTTAGGGGDQSTRKERVLRNVDAGSSSPALCRVRSFTTRTGTVVNKGDTYKLRSRTPSAGNDLSGGGSGASGGGSDGFADSGEVGGPASGRYYPAVVVAAAPVAEPSLESIASITESFFGIGFNSDVPYGSASPPQQQQLQPPQERWSNMQTSVDVKPSASGQRRGGNNRGGGRRAGGPEAECRNGAEEVLPARGYAYPSMRLNPSSSSAAAAGGIIPTATSGFGATTTTQYADEHHAAHSEETVYNVIVLGGHEVGKTTLTHQLLTSEYLANQEYYSAGIASSQ